MEINEIFDKLDEIQKMMQSEEISLEDSFRYYAEAMELLKQCDDQIGTVEKKVLMLDEDGEKHELNNWENERENKVKELEEIIVSYLPKQEGFQKVIMEAMEYSLMAGGKRLRPMLMMETYRMFGGTSDIIRPFLAAQEMIHTYSLVHDDLPAMDNDEYRRGRKTTHIVYGEDMGILAGDAC